VNWLWREGSPDPLVPVDCFSIRWSGWLKAPRPGRYTLKLESDDRSRLWLDGKLVLDMFSPGIQSIEVELSGQPQTLRIDYYDTVLNAMICFSWAQQGGFAMQPVPKECLFHDRTAAEKAREAATPLRNEETPRPKPRLLGPSGTISIGESWNSFSF
jgi:hypothetical protein